MRRTFPVIGLMALALAALTACGGRSEATAPAEKAAAETAAAAPAPPPVATPALWKASDADTTVYLFGTVHVLKPDLIWRTPVFDEAFASAGTVYFETDINPNPIKVQALVLQLGINPAGGKLSDLLDDEQEAVLAAAGEAVRTPPSMLEPMRPWLAALTLAQGLMNVSGYQANSGVEQVLEPEARAAGKDIRKFETMEEQLHFFADLSQDVQIAYLVEGARQIREEPTLLDALVNAWTRGDVEALDDMINEDEANASPEVHKVLLVDRNIRWADTLKQVIDTEAGVIFVAVGAAHIAGADSVALKLRDKGVTVERIQ